MNRNKICVIDFETCSKKAITCQPLQLASVLIDGRKLELIENSIFNSYIKPIEDPKLIEEYKLDTYNEEETQKITGITRNQLENAPGPKVVWDRFVQYLNQFNPSGKVWDAPLLAGYNVRSYDEVIIKRLSGGHQKYINAKKEPYKFGVFDDEYGQCTLFHPIHVVDIMSLVWYWTENNYNIRSVSLDNMRTWMGMETQGAHDALTDVVQSAYLLIKFLKLQRKFNPTNRDTGKIKFKNSFKRENERISKVLAEWRNENE